MQAVKYLGKPMPLEIKINPEIKKDVVTLRGDHIYVECKTEEDEALLKTLTKFYKQEAKKHIDKRLRHFQPQIKKKYKSFVIETNDARWGSCNGLGELTFNWKLMLFPEEAIDYVVIHELCHLEHLNHDRSFWRLVGKLCPDYKSIMPLIGTEKTRDL